MSLASRLSGIFLQDHPTKSSNTSQHAAAESRHEIDGTRQNSRLGNMDTAAAGEIDEELRRPPYLHVSLAQSEESNAKWLPSQCLRAALVELPATSLCTLWILSRPDSKATLTSLPSIPLCPTPTQRSSDKRAYEEDCMVDSRRRCWDRSLAQSSSLEHTSTAREACWTMA
jgi:hypothetical protein